MTEIKAAIMTVCVVWAVAAMVYMRSYIKLGRAADELRERIGEDDDD